MIIDRGGMLSDQHMHAAQKLLAKQFPHLEGLQSPLLSQTGAFTPVSQGFGFFPEGWCII